MSIKFIIGSLLVTGVAVAGSLSSSENSSTADSHVSSQTPMRGPKLEKPLCSSITDNLCQELWDAKHQGNLKTSDGEIRLGRSPKSSLVNLSTLEDNWALIKTQPRLPKDLQGPAKPLLAKLQKLLKKEAETIDWVRRYNRWDQVWQQLLSDVAQDRAIKKSPLLKQTRLSERTQIENSLINREYYKLLDEVTIAKYQNHPNWKRVEKLFEGLRESLLAEISEFPYDQEFKDFLTRRVKSVELTLPLQDIDTFDGRKDCSESAINAYYHPSYNKITVCTGLFNSLKSDSAIYIILAHELSHSIDPATYNSAWIKENGERTKALQPLIGIQGKPLPCQEWEALVAKMQATPIEKKMKVKPYDALAQCLDNDQPLRKPFDPAEIHRQVEEDLVETLNYLANRNLFSSMVIPKYAEFGKEKKNPYFLGPEVFISEFSDKGYAPSNLSVRSYPVSPEVFFQVVQCEYERQKSPLPLKEFFTERGATERDLVLKSSIEASKHVFAMLFEESYYSCGQYCSAFVRKGMARNVEEKFADWMSFRLFHRYLKTKTSLEEKRRASALALANLCDRPSVRQAAGSLLAVEKSYSLAPHPENRARRVGLYNQPIADLLECVPESQESWGSCPLK